MHSTSGNASPVLTFTSNAGHGTACFCIRKQSCGRWHCFLNPVNEATMPPLYVIVHPDASDGPEDTPWWWVPPGALESDTVIVSGKLFKRFHWFMRWWKTDPYMIYGNYNRANIFPCSFHIPVSPLYPWASPTFWMFLIIAWVQLSNCLYINCSLLYIRITIKGGLWHHISAGSALMQLYWVNMFVFCMPLHLWRYKAGVWMRVN